MHFTGTSPCQWPTGFCRQFPMHFLDFFENDDCTEMGIKLASFDAIGTTTSSNDKLPAATVFPRLPSSLPDHLAEDV